MKDKVPESLESLISEKWMKIDGLFHQIHRVSVFAPFRIFSTNSYQIVDPKNRGLNDEHIVASFRRYGLFWKFIISALWNHTTVPGLGTVCYAD